jgi:hypothetical protein
MSGLPYRDYSLAFKGRGYNISSLLTNKLFKNFFIEKWGNSISLSNATKITVNISEDIIDKSSIYSLGYNLSVSAICRIFTKLDNLQKAQILLYIPDLQKHERIECNEKSCIWNENGHFHCVENDIGIEMVNSFIDDFYFINEICKSKSCKLFWYTDALPIHRILNTFYLHKHYLNNNTFYKRNKLISLSHLSKKEREKVLLKMWLKKCTN